MLPFVIEDPHGIQSLVKGISEKITVQVRGLKNAREPEQRNLSTPDYIDHGVSSDIVIALNSSELHKRSLYEPVVSDIRSRESLLR